MSDQQYSLIT